MSQPLALTHEQLVAQLTAAVEAERRRVIGLVAELEDYAKLLPGVPVGRWGPVLVAAIVGEHDRLQLPGDLDRAVREATATAYATAATPYVPEAPRVPAAPRVAQVPTVPQVGAPVPGRGAFAELSDADDIQHIMAGHLARRRYGMRGGG